MAELVVTLTFLRVAQDLVCLGALFEFGLSLFIVGVLVGMALDCHPPIRAFYLIGGGVFANAQNLIIIPLGHNIVK